MFQTILNSALKALPVFAAQFAVTLAMLVGAILVYRAVTPQDETRLIRENNVAAAIEFGSAILSLALPLAMCLARSAIIGGSGDVRADKQFGPHQEELRDR